MKHLLLIGVFFTQSLFAQETPAIFWNNRCDFKTDGTGKSMGLKIKLSVPCDWKQADGERPHVVKKFSYNSGVNTAISTMTIYKMQVTPSKAEINEMFTEAGLKELSADLGTFISGRKLKVDGLDCGEVAFKISREHPVSTLYLYNMYYFFVYGDKMIIIGYATGSTTDEKAKTMFDDYKTLFRALAGNTVFISKWE
jgi:hypothetical protein